ncbi:MAG: HPr(Ser) kinase/phosphatase [Candidatus Omnitrophota bacterium]|jgi:HPr kinase/phosphorylase|nr:MAG: HPr(Ser) kinase/phosphatase [Candidatus Omnitrophota bacterium]
MTDERILKPDPLPVERLLDFPDLDLEVIAGKMGLERTINLSELNRPALELAGFFDKWKPERVQIIGTGEIAYLESRITVDSVRGNLDRIFSHHPPCVVVTNKLPVFDEIIQLADRYEVALLRSLHHSTRFIKRLWDHLELELSPYVVRRGVLMDIFNMGVLITGPSSIGKSECALDLLAKGHTFVADDLILIRGSQLSRLIGTGHSPIPHHMEIRGIGIIDVYRMYGPRCSRLFKQVDMVIQLEDWDNSKEYERLGMEGKTTKILGIDVPLYTIPIKPGRNIGTIVEVAVLDCKMKESGIHMAREFDEKLIQAMRKREGR